MSFMSSYGLQGTLLGPPLRQLILCPSGSTLPTGSKFGDFRGSLKSELICQVVRFPLIWPSDFLSNVPLRLLSVSYLFSPLVED